MGLCDDKPYTDISQCPTKVKDNEEFWCIDQEGHHSSGVWASDCHRFFTKTPVYYRVHDDKVTQVLFVYDTIKCQWAECEDDFNEHTQRLREALHPGVDTTKLSKYHMLMVANGGFDELVRGDAKELYEIAVKHLG